MAVLSGPLEADVKSDLSSVVEGARPKQGYLPALDGWRAVAIFAVMQYHGGIYRLGWFSNRWLHEQGFLGVDLFFAISGFLICSRLMDEDRRRGSISLRGFYIRRSFRIMPAAWLYLAVYSLLALANVLPRDWGGLLSSLLMVRNFWAVHVGDAPTFWYTIHFWSLSVEEHFYLLLPGLLVLVPRGKRLAATGVVSVLSTIWTLAIYHFAALQTREVWLRTDERLCQLMVPAFLAIFLTNKNARDAVGRWLHPWVAFLFVALASVTGNYIHTLHLLAIIIGFPLIVISTVYHPQSWTTRILELPWLRFIGRVSYSLYLWQQMFFFLGHQQAAWPLSVLQHSPLSYLAALTLAVLSYQFIERPLIKIGHRVASH